MFCQQFQFVIHGIYIIYIYVIICECTVIYTKYIEQGKLKCSTYIPNFENILSVPTKCYLYIYVKYVKIFVQQISIIRSWLTNRLHLLNENSHVFTQKFRIHIPYNIITNFGSMLFIYYQQIFLFIYLLFTQF